MSGDMFSDDLVNYLLTHRRPEEWADSMSITILDPDGWRIDGKDFNEPITFEEFEDRLCNSTIQMGVPDA